MHRPKNEQGQLKKNSSNENPPFNIDFFEEYFQYTYYSAGQVLVIEVPPLMSTTLMVLAVDIQRKDARSFDYANYLANALNQGLERIKKNSDCIDFKHYSLLMHLLLYEGQLEMCGVKN